MPEKRSMREKFESLLLENNLKYVIQFMNEIGDNEDFYINILESEKESKKAFENIKLMNILFYEIERK